MPFMRRKAPRRIEPKRPAHAMGLRKRRIIFHKNNVIQGHTELNQARKEIADGRKRLEKLRVERVNLAKQVLRQERSRKDLIHMENILAGEKEAILQAIRTARNAHQLITSSTRELKKEGLNVSLQKKSKRAA